MRKEIIVCDKCQQEIKDNDYICRPSSNTSAAVIQDICRRCLCDLKIGVVYGGQFNGNSRLNG